MESKAVIQVENLGKRYTIGHESGERYLALRDVVAKNARGIWRKTKNLVQGKPVIAGDTLEEIWALRDVSFEVKQGEVIGIIGRNGAGKSTLLKILSRISEPTEGRAVIRGRVASLLEVGTGFHPELTGKENIYLNGSILGMTRKEIIRRFDEIVDFAGVEQFIDTPVKRYSSGMRVRLGFAVAAHLEPEILIVDEVLAVGDVQFQKRCIGKLRDVAKSGRAVLFVSHNMAAIESLCTSAIHFDSGVMKESGDVLDVIAAHLRRPHALSADVDLTNHANTTRVIQRLRITDREGAMLESIPLGSDFVVELSLDSTPYARDLGIGISIYDALGRRITTCHTKHQYHAVIHLREPHIVRCVISNVRLQPGLYSMSVVVSDGDNTIDRFDDGLEIEIVPRDVYGTGRLPVAKNGIYVADSIWEFTKREVSC